MLLEPIRINVELGRLECAKSAVSIVLSTVYRNIGDRLIRMESVGGKEEYHGESLDVTREGWRVRISLERIEAHSNDS